MIWSVLYGPWKIIGCLGLQINVVSSCGWLHLHTCQNNLWHGLPHPENCPLCDQHEETINHLPTSSVFARTFWFNLLRIVGLQALSVYPCDQMGVFFKIGGHGHFLWSFQICVKKQRA
jgi:hypothetical protein